MHEKGGRKIMGNLKSRRIKKMEKKKMDGGKLMNHEVQRISKVEMRADCSLKRVE